MELDQAREFGRRHHRAVLTTHRPSGGIQQSPVLTTVDEHGRFTVSSREAAYKTLNVRADPWAQLLVLDDSFFGSWIWVEGTVDVVSLPDAMEPLVDYYRSISGEHDDWDDYRARMAEEHRVLLRLSPDRAGPDHEG
jgi:PPOX class probable F420-dependent enzyme